MSVPNTHADALELLMRLACDVAAAYTAADELGQLKAIADRSGSIFGPTMRTMVNSHRVRAMNLRGQVAVLANEHLQAFKHSD